MSGFWTQHESAPRDVAQDAALQVRFYMGASLDAAATQLNGGVPKWKEVPYVRIAVPGDKTLVIDQEVWDDSTNPMSHTRRFPEQWKAWNERRDPAVSGHPLKDWAAIPRGLAEECAYQNIHTIEQLAELSDGNAQKLMGGLQWKQRAQAAVDQLRETAGVDNVQAQVSAQAKKIQELEEGLKGERAKLEEERARFEARLEQIQKKKAGT